MTIDVIIPVYRPDEGFLRLLERLDRQTVRPSHLIVINTEQSYWDAFWGTHKEALAPFLENASLEHISADRFDHADTRNLAAKQSRADFMLMMTDDAIPTDVHLLERLLAAFSDETVAVSYARQLPRKGATELEKITRSFNYPDVSVTKSAEDLPVLGIKTYFCSDVCAMYRRSVFDELGGFTAPAIFNEDMVFAARAMERGYKVVYEARACVYHSHSYSGMQQLHRNFDIGVSQAMHPEVFSQVSSEKEGARLMKKTASLLLKSGHALSIITMLYQSVCKYIGFFLGKRYKKLPLRLVRRLSFQPGFWDRQG